MVKALINNWRVSTQPFIENGGSDLQMFNAVQSFFLFYNKTDGLAFKKKKFPPKVCVSHSFPMVT